ncbi:MAG: hypothetical protein ABI880_05550 [Acidobacteriota bacterium]
MTLATALRLVAVAMAVGGVVDPAVTSSRPPPLDVDVAVPVPSTAGAPTDVMAVGPGDASARDVVRALTAAAGATFRVRVRTFAPGERLPCAAAGPCVVVTGTSAAPRGGLERSEPLFTVALRDQTPAAGVTIDDVLAGAAHLDTRATVAVALSGHSVAGRETRLEIRDGAVPVGAARHIWTNEPAATIAVPWWPAQSGRRRLTVSATTAAGDGAPQTERLAVDVAVAATPWPVLVLEPRPSWAATFVRRALESDARLDVDAQATLAPGLVRGVAPGPVDDRRVARARVVVVGGLDGLTDADVRRLERYLAERGGAVVLVPDGVVSGPAAQLLPGRWRHRLEATAADAAGLRASEWLLASGLGAGDVVMASHGAAPTIVSRAIGEGRLVVVGALDAWRFRTPSLPAVRERAAAPPIEALEQATPFTSFWQALVAELARGSRPAVEVSIAHEAGDDHATIEVQARAFAPRTAWTAAARVVCAGGAMPLRLWPEARAGHFGGAVSWPHNDAACEIVATIDGVGEGRAWLNAPPSTRGEARRVVERLRAVAVSSGGLAAAPGDVDAVVRALAALPRGTPVEEPSWPMRSWWWGLGVALALGGEWWLRRQSGAR